MNIYNRLSAVFLCLVDPEEYDEYLRLINGFYEYDHHSKALLEPVRDEDGLVVPGCFYVKPAPVS